MHNTINNSIDLEDAISLNIEHKIDDILASLIQNQRTSHLKIDNFPTLINVHCLTD